MALNEEQVLTVERYISKHKARTFTLGDVASTTGLPVLETERAVQQLMGKYDCSLKVTDQGDLLYAFGSMHERGKPTFRDRIKQFGSWIWKGFTWFYKAWIAITLVVYFVVFLLLLMALIFGAIAAGGDKDKGRSSKGGGQFLSGMFRLVWSIFEWKTFNDRTYRTNDPWGYPYKHYEAKQDGLPKRNYTNERDQRRSKKGFVASVYDFVFGPPRYEIHPLANHMEVASFLKSNKGLVNTSIIQALAGWKRKDAENFMTEVLSRYNGKAEISLNGTLYGEFKDVIRGDNRVEEAPVVWFWDEYEAEVELTGNTWWRNALIIFMNLFNLAFSGVIAFGGLQLILAAQGLPFNISGFIWLGWIPFVFSLIFFTVPLVRMLGIKRQQREQHKENIRKRLMKVIFKRHKEKISLAELTAVANQWASTEERLSPAVVNTVVQDFILDLRGEAYVNDTDASVYYRFDELDQELSDLEELFGESRNNDKLGNVIFES